MEFRVLGPLDVRRADGSAVDPGGPRQRTVLAVLLLESPRVVSVEHLVDAVWPDAPPATARGQIQICVSGLRQRLGPGITTRPPGYLLDPAALDLHAFGDEVRRAAEHTAAGRLADAAELLGAALARWYGAPLAGIDSPAVRAAAVGLEEERARAVEEFAEVSLRLGRHHDLVAVLRPEIDRLPLRERLRGQLMLALHGAGRQADALREFRRARQLSIEELGIEPGEALRRLEQAILRADPALAVPPAKIPRMLPAEVADFTGRTTAIDDVLARLDDGSVRGAPAVVVLSGPGGIGKSALALHLGHRLTDRFPDATLYASLHGTVPEQAVPPAEVLARFLRALGVPGTAVPDGLDERAELYRARLADRSVLLVLDDAAHEAQVLPLLPPDGRSAVLVTSRRRLTALPGAGRVELTTFSADSAVALLAAVVGDRVGADPGAAAELVRLCGHLPLAVRIAAARLAARPHWSLHTMVERLSDSSAQLDELRHGDLAVRAGLQLTYDALGAEERRLLRLLAHLDAPHVGDWAASALLDTDPRRAQDVLDALVELHLVDVTVDPSGDQHGARYHLHDLVRLFAREQPEPERSAALTRYLGALLGLAQDAHRREYGGDFLIVHGSAPRYPVDDGLLGTPLVWLARERQSLVAGVVQAAALGLAATAWDLAISAVVLFEAHSLLDDWRTTHDVGLRAARRAGDRLGEAVLVYSLASLHMVEQRFADARDGLDAALAAFTGLGHEHGAAMVVRNLAFVDRATGDHTAARRHNEHALRVFRAVGDRAGEAYVLHNLAQVDLDLGRVDDAAQRLGEAAAVCATIPNRRVGAQVLYRLGECRLQQGDRAAAVESFTAVLEFAVDVGDRTAQAYALLGLGRADDDPAAARTALLGAEALARDLGDARIRVRALLALSAVELTCGDADTARSRAQEALDACAGLDLPVLAEEARSALGSATKADR